MLMHVSLPISSISSQRRPGFTLIELLVVIAILAILAALLLTGLAKAQDKVRRVQCLNNKRQLNFAWKMYADSNGDFLASNIQYAHSQPNWVNDVMDWNITPGSDNTNVALISDDLLAGYGASAIGLYQCPADHFVSPKQRASSWAARLRSVSQNAFMGNTTILVNANVVDYYNLSPPWQRLLRSSDISNPSKIFVFIDEHPDFISDGIFFVHPDAASGLENAHWHDLPSPLHGGFGTVSYADGHAEAHRWHIERKVTYTAQQPIALVQGGEIQDLIWFSQHTVIPPN
jgi:prepilin-type N-terminal cleavage/methylation domain-containing protein/prepilin-type processing-associated H-X9-DG protein